MYEVRATRSFSHTLGNFTRGRFYQVNLDDPVVNGLVAGGYLVPTRKDQEVPDAVDLAGVDELPDPGVDSGRTRPKKKEPRGAVSDGQDQVEPTPDHDDGPAPDVSGGPELHQAGS
jgi:hypothetical protein